MKYLELFAALMAFVFAFGCATTIYFEFDKEINQLLIGLTLICQSLYFWLGRWNRDNENI